MSEVRHEHVFGPAKFQHLVWCQVAGCPEVMVGTKRGRLRPLTVDERISLIARMMEDIAVEQAMALIHGPERGHQRALEVLGYAAPR